MYATAVLACLLPFCLCVHEKAEHGAAHHYSLYHTKDGHNPVFDQEALLGLWCFIYYEDTLERV